MDSSKPIFHSSRKFKNIGYNHRLCNDKDWQTLQHH